METKPKILVIDDETDILDILHFILRREGFDVILASSGEEALRKLSHEKFDGVVSDLSMPGMDGLTLLKKVRAQNDFIPFIFLSGHAQASDEHEMINFGAFELITKPNVEKVPSSLRSLLKASKEIELLKEVGGDGMDFLELLHSTDRKVV